MESTTKTLEDLIKTHRAHIEELEELLAEKKEFDKTWQGRASKAVIESKKTFDKTIEMFSTGGSNGFQREPKKKESSRDTKKLQKIINYLVSHGEVYIKDLNKEFNLDRDEGKRLYDTLESEQIAEYTGYGGGSCLRLLRAQA